MLKLVSVLALSGCSLYFGNDGSSSGGSSGGSGSTGDAGAHTTDLARPCISTLAVGHLLQTTNDAAYITYSCEGGAVYEHLKVDGGVLSGGDARGDVQELAKRTVVLQTYSGNDEIAMLAAQSPYMWLWDYGGGTRIPSESAFEGVALADVDGDQLRDLVVSGSGSLRSLTGGQLWMPTETTLVTGKSFRFIASAADDQSKLYYVAAGEGTPVELGVATRTSTMPPAYAVTPLATEPPATPHVSAVQPLVVADVDGDGIADVCGALPRVFVRSSRYGALVFLDEQAAAVGAGDVTGDGVADVVFVTADRSAVRRVEIGTMGGHLVSTSKPLLADGGDAIGVDDLDGDHLADVLLLKDANTMASRIVMHLATSY